MSEAQKFEKVKRIIAEQLGIQEDTITTNSRLIEDLGADSLDHIEMVMALEDEFEIEIPDEAAEKATTVEQVLELLPA